VVPLPSAITEFFTKHVGTIKRLQSEKRTAKVETENGSLPSDSTQQDEATDAAVEAREGALLSLEDFKTELNKLFTDEVKEDTEQWKDVVERVISFGPRRIGPNILVDATAVNTCEKLYVALRNPLPPFHNIMK
jgi:ribosome assembly protein 1